MDESISLRELVDADVVQAIQDSFARTVGVSSVIFLPDGDALTRFSNPIKFCTLIQSTKEGRRRCFQSFAEMSRKAVKLSEPEIMYCFAYGAHFVAPIIIDGERKATMYAGQFRPEKFLPEQLEELEKIAVEIDLDPELLVKEANNMRTVGDEVAMDCLHSFVRTVKVIAELGAQAAELRQTKDALQDAYDGLEVRVEERTAELAGANKELRREVAERRAAEEALRESEAKYRLLTETSKDAILSFGMDGCITYLNRAAIELGGYSEDEVLQMNITDILPEDQLSGFYERLSVRAAGGAGILLYEVDFINKAGGRIPVEVNSSMITEDGKPLGILLTCRDITRRKAIEEGLKTSSSLLRSTLESTADGILVVDRAGKTIDFNKKFLEMWSIPDSLAALRDTDKLLEFARAQLTDPDVFLARVRELYARPDAEICDILELKDGRIFERYSTPHQIDGKTVGSVRSFHDITKRKRAEDALRESEEKLRSIVEQSGDGIVLVDEQGTIIEWNRGQERITGLLRTEVLGRPLWDVQFQVTANDRGNPAAHEQVKAGVLKILETGQSEWLDRLEGTVIKRPDGTRRVMQAAVFPIKTDKGFMAGAISRDVTERKAAEEQIKRSLREKDVLMQEIHHRVKNNLQVVSSLLSMQARTTRNKEAIDVLTKSQSRINTMALIHTQLYESGDLSELNMKEFVGTLSEQLFRSYQVNDTKIARSVHVTDHKFPVSVGVHVGLIINELLSNALQYAFGEGDEGKIEVSLTAPDSGRVNLRVSDDGVGLPPGFDINAAKTLGLRLVKILVEDQLQGTLEVISDEGVTFNMEFDISGNGGSSYGEDKNTDR